MTFFSEFLTLQMKVNYGPLVHKQGFIKDYGNALK